MSITDHHHDAPARVDPNSVTTDISGRSCASGCTSRAAVAAGPAGQLLLTTFADRRVAMPRPPHRVHHAVFGQTTTATVTMLGSHSRSSSSAFRELSSGTTNQSHAVERGPRGSLRETITGTYAKSVVINQPDSPLVRRGDHRHEHGLRILQCVTMTGPPSA